MKRPLKRSWTATTSTHAEMSMTPFIGVLQAVLVICMFALPMATHRVQTFGGFWGCDGMMRNSRLEPIRLAIKQTGETYWNGITVNRAQLKSQLVFLAQTIAPPNQPLIEVVGEPSTSYDDFINVFATAKNAGLENVVASIE